MQQRTCSTTSRFLWTFILLCYAIFDSSRSAVTTRRHISRRTMRWKQNSENPHHSLQYVASFGDHKEATITRHSNFLQTFKLGYKIILVCEAEGYPEPSITWYKNGAEMNTHNTAYLVQTQTYGNKVRTRLEIDPATMGDQDVFGKINKNSRRRNFLSQRVSTISDTEYDNRVKVSELRLSSFMMDKFCAKNQRLRTSKLAMLWIDRCSERFRCHWSVTAKR